MPHDLVVRHGLIVDGTGREPVADDIAVDGGFISAVGPAAGDGGREIDAEGCLVTPGFVDIHTHYDGQSIWSGHLAPSPRHGVTTAVMGNCGVGFAPCRPTDHDLLVNAMEDVEDIPEVVMTEGLQWDWETFPDYLDAVAGRPHDIDVAAFLPHSTLRVYAMGARGPRENRPRPKTSRAWSAWRARRRAPAPWASRHRAPRSSARATARTFPASIPASRS